MLTFDDPVTAALFWRGGTSCPYEVVDAMGCKISLGKHPSFLMNTKHKFSQVLQTAKNHEDWKRLWKDSHLRLIQ